MVLGAAALAVLVLGWLFVLNPLLSSNTATADLVPERERLLVRRMDLLARRGQIAAELEAANAGIDKLNARLLTAAAPAVAAPAPQKRRKDMAAAARTEIPPQRLLPPPDAGALPGVPGASPEACDTPPAR